MKKYLQKEMAKRLAEKQITPYAIQKQTGMSEGTIRNILNGNNPNPTLNIMLMLTEILDCSLSDLVGDDKKDPSVVVNMPKFYDRDDLDYELLQTVNAVVVNHTKSLNLSVRFAQVMKGVITLYTYCEENSYSTPPEEFCSWYFKYGFLNEPEAKA